MPCTAAQPVFVWQDQKSPSDRQQWRELLWKIRGLMCHALQAELMSHMTWQCRLIIIITINIFNILTRPDPKYLCQPKVVIATIISINHKSKAWSLLLLPVQGHFNYQHQHHLFDQQIDVILKRQLTHLLSQTSENLTVMTVLQRVGTIVSGGGLSMNGRSWILMSFLF